MAIDLSDFRKAQARAERRVRVHDQAVGALHQLLAQLKDEYGLEDEKAAARKLEALVDEEVEVYRKLNRAMTEFEEKYPETDDV